MRYYYIRLMACLAVLAMTASSAEALDKQYYAPTSKLAEGQWVKIAVQESGIYQITADDILSWGLGSDLSQIHVFGYGGAPLSEVMLNDNYSDDLPQVPVVRSGDRILFYAQGPTTWRELYQIFPYVQVQHPYANTGCYLVTNNARYDDIDITLADNSPTGAIKSSYIERLYHEKEIINPGHTGRNYLGESFGNNIKQMFQFDLNGLVEGSTVSVYPVFAAKTSDANGYLTYWYNDNQLTRTDDDVILNYYNNNYTHYYLAKSVKQFTLDGTDQLRFKVNFSCTGTVHEARLDFITVNYERHLAMRDGCLAFGLDKASRDTTYRLTGCAGSTRVWDVTVPSSPVQQNITMTDNIAAFSPSTTGRREFIAFDESATGYFHPELVGEVPNQNIHAQATPDMIILAPAAYLEQAQRVAALHERYDHYDVLVLDHEQVFNEFSSGTRDAMAYRRLCKMFYDRGESEDGHRLQYLLLFGSGSYDNRMIGTDTGFLDNHKLLTWQSKASNTEENSFTTDDYFAVLDDGSSIDNNDKMNIAVGRMIFRNQDEARTVVDKLENYITRPDYGSWKNRMMFVADDEDTGIHMKQSNSMINTIRDHGGENMVYDHVYIDAFDAVDVDGKRTYPDARAKMFNSLNEGTLWWNYIGCSSTQRWTNEGLLSRSDVDSLMNYSHLPVLYAATADFFRFDNDSVSSGEHMLIKPDGGVIAAIGSARITYLYENGLLDQAMASHIFAGDESGRPMRIGDIIKTAKNNVNAFDDNKRRYIVFGDPAMRLAYAPLTARIESINGQAVDDEGYEPLVFWAHDSVEFSGKIIGLDGRVATDFNGVVVSTLFGPEQSITTHGYGNSGKQVTYEDWSNRLTVISDTVVNGEFTVHVIIPDTVNGEPDNVRPALINLYAYDSRDSLEARGSSSDFYIFKQVADTIGPDIITMVLNDEKFIDGGNVNASPVLLATVADESGVNLSPAESKPSMVLVLDGSTIYRDLVNYYTPMPTQQGTLGAISYQLNDLPEGKHYLTLNVWDVYNNQSVKTITFNVSTGAVPEITAPGDLDIYCAFDGSEMTFYVQHDRLGYGESVTIEVYDLMGRCLWQSTPSGDNATPVTWNMLDNGGTRVPGGIYIYRATITANGRQMTTRAHKLAIPTD